MYLLNVWCHDLDSLSKLFGLIIWNERKWNIVEHVIILKNDHDWFFLTDKMTEWKSLEQPLCDANNFVFSVVN